MAVKQRRFLAITFRVGSHRDGFLVGPILVSTDDYRRFRYWDEPEEVLLGPGDYEIVRLYPYGISRELAEQLFAQDFARGAGVVALFVSAEGLGARGEQGCVVSA
jgi:hypothetical protein